jgi:hypothetical protein
VSSLAPRLNRTAGGYPPTHDPYTVAAVQPERRPLPLGDRLDVVAAVCGAAVLVVLGSGVVGALAADLQSGAAPGPWQQRILLATRAVGLGTASIAVLGAASLSLRRWLGGDEPAAEERIAALVRAAALGVTVFALVGMASELLWAIDATYFRIRLVGEATAIAALGVLAAWLAGPARG